MKKSKMRIIYAFLILVIILSIIYIVEYILLKKEVLEESELLNNYNKVEYIVKDIMKNEIISNDLLQKIGIASGEYKQNVIQKTERISKLNKIREQNSDIVGWLEIEGTSINYPVLQGNDDKYYMNHNYKKQKSKNGSIFLTSEYNWDIPSDNLLIFGHNLNNGTMFQELLKYSNEAFYKKYPIIRFTTMEDDAEYEIISVFKSRVYYKSEKNVFRYYYFVNANNEEEYNEFVKNAKKASLYNIDATAKYGEQLITLSTCSYHVKDGRFAVVAKKIEKK